MVSYRLLCAGLVVMVSALAFDGAASTAEACWRSRCCGSSYGCGYRSCYSGCSSCYSGCGGGGCYTSYYAAPSCCTSYAPVYVAPQSSCCGYARYNSYAPAYYTASRGGYVVSGPSTRYYAPQTVAAPTGGYRTATPAVPVRYTGNMLMPQIAR